MSVENCIIQSTLKDELREDLKQAVQQRIKELGNKYPAELTATVAIRDMTEAALQEAKVRKHQEYLKTMALKGLWDRMAMDPNDPARGLMSVYMADIGGLRQHTHINLRAKSIIAENNSLLPAMAELRPRIFRAGGGVVRSYNAEIMEAGLGRSVKNKTAQEVAQEMKAAIDDLVDRYNAAGGQLTKLEGWFLPQRWIRDKVRKVKKDDWISELLGKNEDGSFVLDRTKMTDYSTGKQLSEDEIKSLLDFVYESISTDGANKWKETSRGQGKSFAKQRDRARALHFTQQGWEKMQSKYGSDDTMENFLSYREELANDIAIMQVLGPNPSWAFERAMTFLEKAMPAEKFTGDGIGHISEKQKLTYLHAVATGDVAPVEQHKWQQWSAASRSLTMALLLQGALIPSMADWAHQGLANIIQGTKMIDRITEYMKFVRNSEQAAEDALTGMIVADTMLSSVASVSKYDNIATRTQQFAAKRAVWTLEKSGLILHTEAGRHAAMNAHRRAWARDAVKTFDQLSEARKAEFKTYGITPEDWEIIRGTQLMELPGYGQKVEILDFHALRKTDERLFRRVHEMMLQESERSVLSTDARAEARLNAYKLNGFVGNSNEFWKHLKMFKRFTFASVGSIENLIKNQNVSPKAKAAALGTFVLTGTFIGASALQLKQVLQGKDPLPMTDDDGNPSYRFWAAAMLYAGVLPFFGDILLDWGLGWDDTVDVNSQSKTLFDSAPVVATGTKIVKSLIKDPIKELFEGDTDQALKELGIGVVDTAKLGAGLFGGNHWAFKTAIQRNIWDPIEEMIDPEQFEAKRRRAQKGARLRGQEFYWEPGETSPSRGPEFKN